MTHEDIVYDLSSSNFDFGLSVIGGYEALLDSVHKQGIQGLISIIQVAIAHNRFDKAFLIDYVEKLCSALWWEGLDDIIQTYTGDDDRWHLWHVNDSGFYVLTARE
jgi:hypothetical protein